MKPFEHQMNIALQDQTAPVRFVHRNSFDHPEGFQLHLNDCVEIYVFVNGQADYIIENSCFSLSKGDALIISPHVVHVPVLKAPCEYERFYLLLPLNIFSILATNPLNAFLKGSPKPTLTDEEKKKVLAILYEISALCQREYSAGRQLIAGGLLMQLLGLLSEHREDENARLFQEPSGVPSLVRQILQYISTALEEIACVGDIAAHFHISPPYLSALFKKHVGVSAGNYLRVKRIALAKQLLERGRSVAYTSYECGFSDSSHFIKNFKQYVGMTPHQYKNIYTKKTDG